MKNKYYKEINEMILNYEVNREVKERKLFQEEIFLKWKIGEILSKIKNLELINEWAKEFTLNYGKNYTKTNLNKFLDFYLRNPNFSLGKLRDFQGKNKLKEKIMFQEIKEQIKQYFLELGKGFTLLGQDFKIKLGNKTYIIDLIFYNYEINALVVLSLKDHKFKPSAKRQLEFYLNLVDAKLKKDDFKRTEGILIGKEKDEYIIHYVSNKKLTSFIKTSKNV